MTNGFHERSDKNGPGCWSSARFILANLLVAYLACAVFVAITSIVDTIHDAGDPALSFMQGSYVERLSYGILTSLFMPIILLPFLLLYALFPVGPLTCVLSITLLVMGAETRSRKHLLIWAAAGAIWGPSMASVMLGMLGPGHGKIWVGLPDGVICALIAHRLLTRPIATPANG